MNRGSPSGRRAEYEHDSGFNEAPIHESGKYQVPNPRRYSCAASMRPRFMNRGSAMAMGGETTRGIRFNEAPIHESGKSQI